MKTFLFRRDLEVGPSGSAKAIEPPFESLLAQQPTVHALALSLLWTRGVTITVAGLGVRVTREGTTGDWQSLIAHQVMDADGEFSCPIGLFEPEDQLELMIVVMAMDADVAAAVVAVTDVATAAVTQVVPPPPAQSEKMDRGVPWVKNAKVTV